MSARLLVITRHRLNENNGGSNASKGFISCFSALFDDCSIIYPEFSNPASYIPGKYKLYPCHDGRSKLRKGLDCYCGVLSPLASFAKKHLSTHSYDVIAIDHSFIGASLVNTVKATGAKVITIHHNVERDYQRDNQKEYSLLFRFPYIYFAEKAERDCLYYSDLNLTVTAKDASTFRSWYPNKDMHIHYWGIFEYQPIVSKVFAAKINRKNFIITGSLHFYQSLLPILEFINRYWPVLRQVCPCATLTIAGRNPSEILQRECASKEGITLIPNPDDMAALVQQADYYICPINAGSGLKLRVMDGLRQGLPVLCHKISSHGYEALLNQNCLFAYNDEQTFVNSLHQMLSSSVTQNAVYQAFCDNFSLKTGINRLRQIMEQEKIAGKTCILP